MSMKTLSLYVTALIHIAVGHPVSALDRVPATRPNILIVLADDMGWGDPQCYQAASKIPTPAIDRLAAEGMRFTDAHTPSAVCTPTRYTLLTGRYCWRTRLKSHVLDGFDPPLIGSNEDTLATMLRRAGYRTHCVGKWHLGMQWTTNGDEPVPDRDKSKGFRPGTDIDYTKPLTGGPNDVGFDSYFGISASLDMSPYVLLKDRHVIGTPNVPSPENRDGLLMNQVAGVTTSDFKLVNVLPRLGKEASQVIRDAAGRNQPFFCYVPLTSPHLPVVPTEEATGKSNAGSYGDFVVATDQALGEMLKALDDTQQANNTLVLFTSDNGGLFHQWTFRADDDGGKTPKTKRGSETFRFGHQSNAGWRGTKADIYEGGHRVPFVVRWPGVTPKHSVCEELIELTDVFATVAELTSERPHGTSGMDSFTMLQTLRGDIDKPIRPYSIHHSLHGMFAVRQGDWKLIDGRGSGGFTRPRSIDDSELPGQLYNLKSDPQERRNLYRTEPARVKELKAILSKVQ